MNIAHDKDVYDSILIHNLSHADLLFSLRSLNHATDVEPSVCITPSGSAYDINDSNSQTKSHFISPESIIAVPKFNRYKEITSEILKHVTGNSVIPAYAPSKQSSSSPSLSSSSSTSSSYSTLRDKTQQPQQHLLSIDQSIPTEKTFRPYGFTLTSTLRFPSYEGIRLRSDTSMSDLPPQPTLLAIYFPMLAVLIPKWIEVCERRKKKRAKLKEWLEKGYNLDSDEFIQSTNSSLSASSLSTSVLLPSLSRSILSTSPSPTDLLIEDRLHLYLLSGSGMPWNPHLSSATNSTKAAVQLAAHFISTFYPKIHINLIHSESDIFHLDANVSFVNTVLRPKVEEKRKYLARLYGDAWKKHLYVTISMTDAASARMTAINASLRSFSPDCLHFWQLKSFWHEYPHITGKGENDVELHEFQKVEMTPPLLVSDCDKQTKELVEQVRQYKKHYESIRDSSSTQHELSSFWLRKSKQPVLSVLMIKKKGEKSARYFRGLNMEVSMPTGSLCSERSAVGTALSVDPSLKRREIKMIAVLALPLTRSGQVLKEGIRDEKSLVNLTDIQINPLRDELFSLPPSFPHQFKQKNKRKNYFSHAHYKEKMKKTKPILISGSVVSPIVNGKIFQHHDIIEEEDKRVNNQLGTSIDQNIYHIKELQQRELGNVEATLSNEDVSTSSSSSDIDSDRDNRMDKEEEHVEKNEGSHEDSNEALDVGDEGVEEDAGFSRFLHPQTRTESNLPPSPVPTSPSPCALPISLPSNSISFNSNDSSLIRLSPTVSPPLPPQPDPTITAEKKKLLQQELLIMKLKRERRGEAIHQAINQQIPNIIGQTSGGANVCHNSNSTNQSSSNYSSLPSSSSSSSSSTSSSAFQLVLDEGRNPMNPCGACNEWLKKINEVNPEFKIITFTSEDCTAVFIKPV